MTDVINDTLQLLTEQMIKDKFENEEEKYIVTKQDLYKFSIKLIKIVKEVKE